MQDLAERRDPVRFDVQVGSEIVRQILDALYDVNFFEVLLAVERRVQLGELPPVLLRRFQFRGMVFNQLVKCHVCFTAAVLFFLVRLYESAVLLECDSVLPFWRQTAPVFVAELVHQELPEISEVLAALQERDGWLVCAVWVHAIG